MSKAALFIPCLIDQAYPEIGMAMVRVLRQFNIEPVYNREQVCCGQPAFNAGHNNEARIVARHFLKAFNEYQPVVCPSGSCTALVQNYYPELFADAPEELKKLKLFEFSQFLVTELGQKEHLGELNARISFHNSCHSLRELRVEEEPLQLLRKIKGAELIMPEGQPTCCGFGGLFSFKFASVAATMAQSRLEIYRDLGIEILVSNDPGCISHMRAEAQERGINIEILHLAEILDRALAGGSKEQLHKSTGS